MSGSASASASPDGLDALTQPVAADPHVVGAALDRDQRVLGPDHVAGAHRQRIKLQPAGQLIDRGVHGEHRLAQPVSAQCPGRHRVGVDRVGVDLLAGAAIQRDRLAAGVKQDRRAVVAVGAGVGHDPQRDRRQPARPRRRPPGRGPASDGASSWPRTAPPGSAPARPVGAAPAPRPPMMSSTSISCLPPKPPPTRRGEHAHSLPREAGQPAERVARQERRLASSCARPAGRRRRSRRSPRASPGAHAGRGGSRTSHRRRRPTRPAPPRRRRSPNGSRRRGCARRRRSAPRIPCRRAAAALRAPSPPRDR